MDRSVVVILAATIPGQSVSIESEPIGSTIGSYWFENLIPPSLFISLLFFLIAKNQNIPLQYKVRRLRDER